MKRFNFIQAVFAVVLMITVASCTTMTGAQDEYYERGQANRVYVEDPYRGTVVLERDPYTGRYYEVNSYGYDNRVYRSNNGYYGNGSYGRNNSRYRTNNNGYYPRSSSPRVYQNNQQPSEEQKKEHQQSRDEARRKVLGN
jgi:hypothetical protein